MSKENNSKEKLLPIYENSSEKFFFYFVTEKFFENIIDFIYGNGKKPKISENFDIRFEVNNGKLYAIRMLYNRITTDDVFFFEGDRCQEYIQKIPDRKINIRKNKNLGIQRDYNYTILGQIFLSEDCIYYYNQKIDKKKNGYMYYYPNTNLPPHIYLSNFVYEQEKLKENRFHIFVKDYIHFRMLNIFSEPLKGPLTIQNFHEALKYIFNGIFGENKKEFKEERKLLRMSIR